MDSPAGSEKKLRGRPMTRDEVSAFDLRNAGYHEAAHVVVARSLGYNADAVVFPNPSADALGILNTKLWLGRTFLPMQGQDDRRIIGLAGEIAVLMLAEPDISEWDVLEHLDLEGDTVSLTDGDAIAGHTREDIDRTLMLVRELWSDIGDYAQELVELAEELEG